MAKLLFIDTSAGVATVAVSSNGAPAVVRTHENAQEQAAVIHFMIEDALKAAGITLQELDAFCVCAGPGSYTGLRVGLSAAKGMAYATDRPLMLFNKLDLLAGQSPLPGKPFVVALKARKGEYFIALFDEQGEKTEAPRHAFEQELEVYAAKGYHFFTDDAGFAVGAPFTLIVADRISDIQPWIDKAAERFSRQQFDDLAYSEPFYLKAAYTTQSKK